MRLHDYRPILQGRNRSSPIEYRFSPVHLYYRWPRLLGDILASKGEGNYLKHLNKLAKANLLIIDDFGLNAVNDQDRKDFLEIVEEPTEDLVNPPLQSVLLLPSGPIQLNLYEIASSKQITKKTISANEMYETSNLSDKAIVELNIRYST